MCDLKSKVNCIMVPEIPEEEELEDFKANSNLYFNKICFTNNTSILILVDISCPPTGAHFYPHPTDCQHYFLCVSGISALLDCGHNMIYDFATQKCDLASRATCISSVL